MTREDLERRVLETINRVACRDATWETRTVIRLVVEACCARIGIKEEADDLRATFLPTETPDD